MEKVLILRFSSLGDIILATSVIEPLYENKFEIDFLTFKPFDTLFIKDYRVKNVLAYEKKQIKTLKDLKKLANILNKYDFILDLHLNLRTKLLSIYSKSEFISYDKKSLQRRLLTKPILKNFVNLREFNVLKSYQQTLEKLGIRLEKIYKPKIILSESEVESVKNRLPETFVVLGAGARYKGKRYPYFDKLSEIFLDSGFDIVLIGSKEDKIADKSVYPGKVIDLRGKLTIRESLSVISLSQLTISNDSAISHMARAVSTPVLMIYGATHPYFGFYPLKEEGEFIFKNLQCQPCDIHGKKECKFKTYPCLTEISPEFVFDKSIKLLKKEA